VFKEQSPNRGELGDVYIIRELFNPYNDEFQTANIERTFTKANTRPFYVACRELISADQDNQSSTKDFWEDISE